MQILALLVVTVKAMSFAKVWDNSFANDTAMDNFLSDFKVRSYQLRAEWQDSLHADSH